MKGKIINQNIEQGVFKKHFDGFYLFAMENGEVIVFEEISDFVTEKFDLKSDRFKGKSFEITYSEYVEDDNDDFLSFKIEKLELVHIEFK